MLRCIINADDFGKNEVVNTAIIEAIDKDYVTSTTIMANGDCVVEAVEYSKKKESASFGVHLVLTEGHSMTSHPDLLRFGIIDDNGFFVKNGIRNASLTMDLKQAILEEWDAQIKYLKSLGLSISHADSHHHVHHILFDVFDKVLITNGITKYRNHYFYPFCYKQNFTKPEDTILSTLKHSWPLQYIKYITSINRRQCSFVQSQEILGLRTTNYFMSYKQACDLLMQKPFWKDNVSIELMCHPGHPNYQEEMTLLSNRMFISNDIEFINFIKL